jgi:hypothetical protein
MDDEFTWLQIRFRTEWVQPNAEASHRACGNCGMSREAQYDVY